MSDFTPKSLVRVDPEGSWSEFEFRLLPGPANIGVVGAGTVQDLYGFSWAILADKITDTIRLFRAIKDNQPVSIHSGITDAGWQELPFIPIIHAITDIAHLAACFDQAAQPVVAYERDGQIHVRQYDPLTQVFVYRGPFAGVDPVLLQDSTVGYNPSDSDVHLYYLDAARTGLHFRVQRELYNTERLIRAFPNPVALDMAIAAPYQIQLVGSFLQSLGQTGYVVRSEPYPVRITDTVLLPSPVTLNPATDWDYMLIVLVYTWIEEAGEIIANATLDEWIGDAIANIAIGTGGQAIAPTIFIATSWSYILVVIVVNTITDPGYPPQDNLGAQTMSVATDWSYIPA